MGQYIVAMSKIDLLTFYENAFANINSMPLALTN